MQRKAYPSDVSAEEWALVVPYVTLMSEDGPQREHSLRELFKGVRWIVRTGAAWRRMPPDLPPWSAVYPQGQRWRKAGVFEASGEELRAVVRVAPGRNLGPTAAILASRRLHSSPERGARAGYDGAKRRRGSKVHIAVDTWGPLLALCGTAANEQDRAQVEHLAEQGQAVTGENGELAFVDHADTGDQAAQAAARHGIKLEVVKLPEAQRGFVLLPKRWAVERSFAWAARFRRLARDSERLPETLAGLHFLAFAILLLQRFVTSITQST